MDRSTTSGSDTTAFRIRSNRSANVTTDASSKIAVAYVNVASMSRSAPVSSKLSTAVSCRSNLA
ncbi:unannotated protein [freshwater metagenome]|uniref:Unannotated protein n=1 Tax=freshwater metagenome TaxID=449393 RepID=A0A6J7IN86_9ZZZZ